MSYKKFDQADLEVIKNIVKDEERILYAENIALYIKVWHKNHNCLMDNYTQVLTNIIHIKLLEYYSFSTISNYDINLVCHAVENLINMFGYSFL